MVLTSALAADASAATLNVPGDYATIQAAIDAASDGDTILIADGTYPESLNIYGKGVTLQGTSEAGTIIDASTFNDYSVDADGDYAFGFADLTVIGYSGAGAAYGIKVFGDNATVTISNVTVQDSYRSCFDLNGLSSGSLTDVTALNAGYGGRGRADRL